MVTLKIGANLNTLQHNAIMARITKILEESCMSKYSITVSDVNE